MSELTCTEYSDLVPTTDFTKFDPEGYISDYYAESSWLYGEGEDLPFTMRQLHEIFKSGTLDAHEI